MALWLIKGKKLIVIEQSFIIWASFRIETKLFRSLSLSFSWRLVNFQSKLLFNDRSIHNSMQNEWMKRFYVIWIWYAFLLHFYRFSFPTHTERDRLRFSSVILSASFSSSWTLRSIRSSILFYALRSLLVFDIIFVSFFFHWKLMRLQLHIER